RSWREHGLSPASAIEGRSPSRHVLGGFADRPATAVLPPHRAGTASSRGVGEGVGGHGGRGRSLRADAHQRRCLVSQGHPVVARYMATFGAAIKGIDAEERAAIEQEIRSHIAEATATGRSLDAVLTSLGPAEALARAYTVELLMNPRDRRIQSVTAFLKLAA